MRRRLAIAGGALSLLLTGVCVWGLAGHPTDRAVAEIAPRAEQPQSLPVERLTVATRHGARTFSVMVADNDLTREIGLMHRRAMRPEEGMIFDFHDPQPVAFWMRNTLIPLDIIFIAPDGKILNIAENARPMDETPLPSAGPVRAVLEINGGLSAKLGIRPGDRVLDAAIFTHRRRH